MINNGNFDELIKKGGFIYRPGNIENERSQRVFEFEKIRISKGEKKVFTLEYQNYNINKIWELGLRERKSYIIAVYLYLITIDNQGREIYCETKIGQIEINENKQEWKDDTPKVLDLFESSMNEISHNHN